MHSIILLLLRVSTSESMIPRPYFQALKHRLLSFCLKFDCCHFYFRLQLPLIIIHITCISLSLRRTSALIHLTSVLGVLGTQETSCILIVGLLERDIFDLYLPEFDKPWVIHLRELAAVLQTSALGGPTLSIRIEACSRHHRPIVDLGFHPRDSPLSQNNVFNMPLVHTTN